MSSEKEDRPKIEKVKSHFKNQQEISQPNLNPIYLENTKKDAKNQGNL